MNFFQEHGDVLKAKFEFQSFQKALDFGNLVWNIAQIPHYDYRFLITSSCTHDVWDTITDTDYAIVKLIEVSYKK